ncbi:hypothetical protein M758_11G137800 [Ceratodon purpureus]|nr:hypothetical protein M758_11G137800 [Ceratodon purpureus]
MNSHEVVAEVETLKIDGEANRTVELSGGSLEASLQAGLVEEICEARDVGNKKIYKCRICEKTFEKYQALGGHMNKHPHENIDKKLMKYEVLREKLNLKTPKIESTRDYTPETPSYNLFLQRQQQMEHFQALPVPMDPQLFRSNAPTNDSMFARGLSNSVTTTLNMPNPSPYYVPSGTALDGHYERPSIDPSLCNVRFDEYSNLPVPSDMPMNSSCGSPALPTPSGPASMSSNAMDGYHAPCQGPCCNEGRHHIEHGHDFSSTLGCNRPSPFKPLDLQMNDSSYVPYEDSSDTTEEDPDLVAFLLKYLC